MANEISISTTIRIKKGNLNYSPPAARFTEDLSDDKGPTPGFLTISVDGENVTFGELATPGRVRIQNLDPDNYVEFGVHDGSLFHPLGEVLPGTEATFRFSRNLGEELTVAPGTGSTAPVNYFFIKADTAPCGVIVDAFEA